MVITMKIQLLVEWALTGILFSREWCKVVGMQLICRMDTLRDVLGGAGSVEEMSLCWVCRDVSKWERYHGKGIFCVMVLALISKAGAFSAAFVEIGTMTGM